MHVGGYVMVKHIKSRKRKFYLKKEKEKEIINARNCIDNCEKLELKLVLPMTMMQILIELVNKISLTGCEPVLMGSINKHCYYSIMP